MFTLVLFLLLLGILGVQTVHSRSIAMSCRYEMARMLVQERKLDEDTLAQEAEITRLVNPDSLRDRGVALEGTAALKVSGGGR